MKKPSMKRLVSIAALCALVFGASAPAAFAQYYYGSATLTISPNNQTVQNGQSLYLTAVYDPDGYGSQLSYDVSSQANWNSSNSAIATYQGNGQFRAWSGGTITITASYQGTTAYATLTVNQYGYNYGSGNGSFYAQTQSATNVTQNSAALNGFVNANGVSATAHFEYGFSQSLGQTSGYQTIGGYVGNSYSSNVNAQIYNLQPGTTYYYRVVVNGQYGTSYGSIMSFTTTGGGYYGNNYYGNNYGYNGTNYDYYGTNYYDTNAYNTYTGSGSGLAVTLSASNVTQTSATLNGTITSQPSYNYNNNYNNYYGNYNYGYNSYPYTYNNSYNTNYYGYNSYDPYSYSYTNSFPYNTNYYGSNYGYQNYSVNTYFQYGTTTGLGKSVGNETLQVTGSQNVSAYVTNLQPGTTYYYRIVAQSGSLGTVYGSIMTFTTPGSPVVYQPAAPRPQSQTNAETSDVTPPAPASPAYVSKVESLVVSADTMLPRAGDEFTVTIHYKNGANGLVSNAVLNAILPQETAIISANPNPTTASVNGASFALGTLSAGMEGAVSLRLKTSQSAMVGASLPLAAIMTYTNSDGKQQSVAGNVLVSISSAPQAAAPAPGQTSANVANALGTGTASFWILVLILVMLAVNFIYLISRDRSGSGVRQVTSPIRPFTPSLERYGSSPGQSSNPSKSAATATRNGAGRSSLPPGLEVVE